MPELPEVEAARRAVEEHCKGGLIQRALIADDTKVVEGISPGDMQRVLVGKTIVAAHRKGKQLWLELDKPPGLCFQFGMAGAVYIKGVKLSKYVRSAVKDEDEWPSKYSKVCLELSNGVEMSFTDKRRFARIRLLDDPATSPPVSELGPDAFTELPEEEEFSKVVVKKKVAIKAVLLDQSFLSGIGNWIADEVLYQSRIHPEQPASTLSVDDCKRLRQAIKEVLETAIDAEADPSKYPEGWLFHHREKNAANASLNGKKIEFITVGGRTSAYVPELQKYDGVNSKRTRAGAKKAKEKQKQEEDDEEDAAAEKGKAKNNGAKRKRATKSKQEEEDRSQNESGKANTRGRKKQAEIEVDSDNKKRRKPKPST